MRKSNIIDEITDRLHNLEEDFKGIKKPPAKKKKTEVDEDVCPTCGGDLLFVEEGIVLCPACNKYFEEGEEE
jgi:uncharacterized protein with PIN domain